MSLPGLIKDLYSKTIGGGVPASAADANGDISAMIKYIIANPPGVTLGVDPYSIPDSATGAGASSSSADTYGAYVQLIASTTADLYITGYSLAKISTTGNSFYAQVELATGAAAAEVPIGVFNLANTGAATVEQYGFVPIKFPIAVPSGTRIAYRVKDSMALVVSYRLVLHVIDAADVG